MCILHSPLQRSYLKQRNSFLYKTSVLYELLRRGTLKFLNSPTKLNCLYMYREPEVTQMKFSN